MLTPIKIHEQNKLKRKQYITKKAEQCNHCSALINNCNPFNNIGLDTLYFKYYLKTTVNSTLLFKARPQS